MSGDEWRGSGSDRQGCITYESGEVKSDVTEWMVKGDKNGRGLQGGRHSFAARRGGDLGWRMDMGWWLGGVLWLGDWTRCGGWGGTLGGGIDMSGCLMRRLAGGK